MKRRQVAVTVAILSVVGAAFLTGETLSPGVDAARRWRHANEVAIVSELAELVAIPNLATAGNDIMRNAKHIEGMLRRRGVSTRLLHVDGAPPVVYGEVSSPGATRTVVLYAHYDGQPVVAERWTTPPWTPVLRTGKVEDGAASVRLDELEGPADGEWRLYGRSTSDDKAPIVAILAAIDALHAAKVPLGITLKLFFEGEEEGGSPHLGEVLRSHRELLNADLWIFCDGPVHQTRRSQLVFGARGVTRVTLTTFGPVVPLHSGHYGNWAPDPGMALVQLLATMRDPEGTPTIAGFSDAVRPLDKAAKAALEEQPEVEGELRRQLALGWTEGEPQSLPRRLLGPAVNLLGFETGAVGPRARNAIPSRAEAVVGFRLVPDLSPERVRELVESHIRRQGFFVVEEEPSAKTLRTHARVVRAVWGEGYRAAWTPMDLAVSRALVRVIQPAAGGELVVGQSMGGSLPLYLFQDILQVPFVILPTVNHDNNQHAPDENIRLAELFRAVEVFAAVLADLGEAWK